jgi:hypothetical protein
MKGPTSQGDDRGAQKRSDEGVFDFADRVTHLRPEAPRLGVHCDLRDALELGTGWYGASIIVLNETLDLEIELLLLPDGARSDAPLPGQVIDT